MKYRYFAGGACAILFTATMAFSQSNDAASSGPAVNGSPAWYLGEMQGMIQTRARPTPDAGMAGCADDIKKYCSASSRSTTRYCLLQNAAKLSGQCKASATAAETAALKNTLGTPYCYKSPVCDPANERGGNRLGVKPVLWKQTMGYSFAYPIASPEGERYGMVAVATDSKDNLWGLQRNPIGRPQLFKWDKNGKLLLSIGDDVITHHAKAHGIAVDAQDNLWITDAAGATAKKISPDGKVLMTIGTRGHRGDWDEAKGQRYLWEPLMVGFNARGDIYIAQGHGHESPNDTDSSDPTNNSGAARILRLDKNGKFIQQWWGNAVGQGKFVMAHGFAVDPRNGDVYIGGGHANESPNDVDGPEPWNVEGVARVIHLTKDGKFVGQWFGNEVGQGKFDSTHGFAIDPTNGDVWIGDREQYRIVVYTADGRFVKTLQMKNLVCALNFDHKGNPWMASGQDGQFQKMTRDGKIVGAIGNGMGVGFGQFTEASYWVFDPKDNLIAGDTSVGRVTVMSK